MCQTFLLGPVPRMKGRNREGRQARGWRTIPGFFAGDRHLEHTQSERRVRVWRLGQTDKTAREGLTSLVVQCLGQSTSKQGAWVLSMVGEPRCHIPCSVAKKKGQRKMFPGSTLLRHRTEKEGSSGPENSNREREAAAPVWTRAIPMEQRTQYSGK